MPQRHWLPLLRGKERPILIEHQLPVHGRWGAQCRDGKPVQHLQCPPSAECLSVVVHEQRGAAVPRAEERPRCFRPPLLRQIPVYLPWPELQPMHSRQGVGERIRGLRVQHDFRRPGCSRGEEREGRRLGRQRGRDAELCVHWDACQSGVEVNHICILLSSFHGAFDLDDGPEPRTPTPHRQTLCDGRLVSDERCGLRHQQPRLDVLVDQQRRAGTHDDPRA